ncbi:O-antigen ligase family protein [Spongiivirga citrea]|uniref:O-antigen ligase-related domain-containing protein n=1 Tax=Spongiivirga citrea TaxID=1481457 RepID=A0A6M0CTS8_9FLAO|nr:O-antigen ligase family protein [Spongiivirga citrea]NER18917.1 hypothetical protein [Spongiivirga citrea]
MKAKFKKKVSEVTPFMLVASLIAVMFSFFLSSMFLAAALLMSLVIFDYRKFTYKNLFYWGLISTPFLLILFSSFFSYDIATSTKQVVKRVPLLLVPFIVIQCGSLTKIKLVHLLFFFGVGCSFANLYGIINGIIFSFRTGSFFDPNHLFYFYTIQHVYLATFNVFVLFGSLFYYSSFQMKNLKTIIVLVNIINMVSFLLLSSKMALGILVISLILFFYLKFSFRKASFVIFVLILILSSLIFNFFPAFLARFSDFMGGDEPRLVIWKCVWEQISLNSYINFTPIGDFQTKLDYCYYSELYKFSLEGFNTHNLYLEIWLVSGLFGLITYFITQFLVFREAIRSKGYFLKFLMIIIFLFGITESIFERQYGILFYSVFLSLFVFNNVNRSLNMVER